MAVKNGKNTNLLLYVIVAVLAGGLIGYWISQNNKPFSAGYINQTASMMKNNGNTMMQMGQMMMSTGQMMQQRGQKYGDLEMMQKGKELEDQAQGIQIQGANMMERGNGMFQMMGQ